MARRRYSFLFCFFAASLFGANASAETPAGYILRETIPVGGLPGGKIEIFEDRRITKAIARWLDHQWGSSNAPYDQLEEAIDNDIEAVEDDQAADKDEALISAFFDSLKKGGRLKNAIIRVSAGQDGVKDFTLSWLPRARVRPEKFDRRLPQPTYLISADGGGTGSTYAGIKTMLIDLVGGKPVIVQTIEDAEAKQDDRLWLVESTKSQWKLVPTTDGSAQRIHEVESRPNYENPKWADTQEFVTLFSTIWRGQDGWHRATKRTIGIWDANKDAWPSDDQFPR